MKTKTIRVFGNAMATYGKRKRVAKNRFGIKMGETFTGFHFGKTSHYITLPSFAQRKFGGVNDIS